MEESPSTFSSRNWEVKSRENSRAVSARQSDLQDKKWPFVEEKMAIHYFVYM